tara:strand:- start:120958 stop:121119 length:162 start_codon:yes stop_codon:yes gene_type:complete
LIYIFTKKMFFINLLLIYFPTIPIVLSGRITKHQDNPGLCISLKRIPAIGEEP